MSIAPSKSLVPSAAPTLCALKVTNGVQRLDMVHDDPYTPRVVIDGRSALAVAHGNSANSAFNVVFYSLTDAGWERNNVFVNDEFTQYYSGGTYSSAISGKTAFVGFWKTDSDAGTPAVHVYRQDDLGLWKRAESLLPDNDIVENGSFGFSMDIDGDLACVAATGEGAMYIFRQVGKRWRQTDKISLLKPNRWAWECLIAGETLAIHTFDWINDRSDGLYIYRYDQQLNNFTLLQDPLPANTWGKALSEKYLVFSELSHSESGDEILEGLHIYHRQSAQDKFTPLQFLNASDHVAEEDMFGAKLVMDRDLLVVMAYNETVIYGEQNGYWEEALVLDFAYSSYQISGRSLLTTGYERDWNISLTEAFSHQIFAFNIEGCTQSMPTQLPSMSPAPTIALSEEKCYPIDVEVLFDSTPGNTAWEIIKKTEGTVTGDGMIVKSYEGTWLDASKAKSWKVCLPQGQYDFRIYDNGGEQTVKII